MLARPDAAYHRSVEDLTRLSFVESVAADTLGAVTVGAGKAANRTTRTAEMRASADQIQTRSKAAAKFRRQHQSRARLRAQIPPDLSEKLSRVDLAALDQRIEVGPECLY